MMKLGILASGRGSNMNALIEACNGGRLSAKVAVVISNNKNSGALDIARRHNIAIVYLSAHTYPNPHELDLALRQSLLNHGVNLVLLAGFMKKIGPLTLSAFRGNILNIHPSLLPRFGGRGMYGLYVHEAVIAAGEKETGVTIHLVEGEYDTGEILAQRKLPVLKSDTAKSLAARVLRLEHELYPETVQKIIDGNIILPGTGRQSAWEKSGQTVNNG